MHIDSFTLIFVEPRKYTKNLLELVIIRRCLALQQNF